MKKKVLFAAMALVALASCSTDEMIGVTGPQDNSPSGESNAIVFASATQGVTRAGEFVGATAAEKLGGMFVVEGTKGSEQEYSPSTTVVFDNYLVGYDYNSAGKTESNTNNWEYVGLESGITDRMTGKPTVSSTWDALHPTGTGFATAQTVKYWDYSTDQYDFIAWSTGICEAVTDAASNGKVKVTRINTGTDLSSTATGKGGFSLTAARAADLLQCYYTDINTVLKANYGAPVTLTFKNMAAKVRVALYETVPGYSVKDVEFYTDESTLLTADVSSNKATLYTPDGLANQLPQSGTVLVYYPRIGTANRGKVDGVDATYPNPAADYNKASVTVTAGDSKSPTQSFGTFPNSAIGTNLPGATFAGDAEDGYYQAVIPNTNSQPLTLRVNYTLVSTDGSGESIKVYGAKAVVPSTYTKWLPNYAYTYIFKISDNTNGWTDTDGTAQGLLPITFDAVVTSFVDANAEQTTVTTVATPSITTYQQNHNTGNNGAFTVPDEYDNDGAMLYVKVMNDGTPVTGLTSSNSLLFKITKKNALDEDVDYVASEAEVMDALQNRTNLYSDASPIGRNGIYLTAQTNGPTKVINNEATSIVNGVDNQLISVTSGHVAEINLADLEGTFAYVYVSTPPTSDEAIYNLVSDADASADVTKYYPVTLGSSESVCGSGVKATAGKVYFVPNKDAQGRVVSYTFKQTKVNDNVEGLVEKSIPAAKATAGSYVAANFYFDVYNQNKGAYAVKVIKVVD